MSAIKRIHRDLIEWRESERNFRTIFAEPIEDDMFTWHFNMVVKNDESDPVAIHGQITFPQNYPFSPPSVAFFGCVPHRQVTRASPDKMAVLCLDMLQGNNQGYYSGWSSAYSVVSVLAQIETLLDGVAAHSIPRGWRQFRCCRCSHDGSRPSEFYPQIRCHSSMLGASHDTVTVESRSNVKWSRLNRDVEGIIFSYLSQNDYRVLVHVDTHIKRVLHSYRWYHWKTIECYHSHANYGSFVSAVESAATPTVACEDLFLNLFGIGFSVDYFENESRGRRGAPSSSRTTLVLKDVYVMPDVLTYRAFEEGVTFSMWRDTRFTSFLPLYLNNLHGSYAMALAEKVVCEQYHVGSTEEFEPTLMLQFLSKLMNTTVVSLMRELEECQEENGGGVQLFTSIKALQSYMYFYHLLLGFSRKYPRITSYARKKVYDFVKKADCRDKKHYPDLGEFLVYLSIVPSMKWKTFGPIFAKECFVRNAKWILQRYPELITTDRNTDVSCIRLRRTWETSRVGKRLQMFQYYFLQNVCGVGSSDGSVSTLEMKLEGYNRTLGQVDESVAIGLQRRCRAIFQVDDWMQYFSMVNLPCPSARALSHLLRMSMVESDRNGYQRFIELQALDENDLIHENSDLCLCSGSVRSLAKRETLLGESKMEEVIPARSGMGASSETRFLDVAFSVDCTGSMSSYLTSVKHHIEEIAVQLTREVTNLNVRFAIVGYRDHGIEAGNWSPSVTKWFGFAPVHAFKKNLSHITVGGGGGVEAVADAWHQVLGLNWRRASVKAVIHIADIGGHGLTSDADACPDGFDPIVLAKEMLASNMTLYNVGCRMRGEIHENFYKAMAFMTGGLYLTLENARKLPEVIVESTREGMSLTRVMPMAFDLVNEFKKEHPYATKDQLVYLVWRELVERRVMTRKVECVVVDEELSEQVYDASTSRDLAECRKILNDSKYRMMRRATTRSQECNGSRPHASSRFESDVDGDDRLITFEQALRCVTRAEYLGNRMEWMKKGCVYQMAKYNVNAARARYNEHGLEYSGKLMRIKRCQVNESEMVEYNDYKTHRIFAASVVRVDRMKYSVTVVVRGLRNARREVPVTSRNLRKMGTVLTAKNKAFHFSGVVDPAISVDARPNPAEMRSSTRRGELRPRKNVGRETRGSTGKRGRVVPRSVRVQLGGAQQDVINEEGIENKPGVNFASVVSGNPSVMEEAKEEVEGKKGSPSRKVVEHEARNTVIPVEMKTGKVEITPSPTPPLPPSQPMIIRSFSLCEADLSDRSAMCVVLPPSLWQDIQAIRRQHDKSFQHWRMPMIKVLCPFVDRVMFEEHAEHLSHAFRVSGLTPFRVKLTGFGAVKSARIGEKKMVEVFLKTEIVSGGKDSWEVLMDALSVMYPNCVHLKAETRSHFNGRIVVGQIPKKNAQQVVRGWKAAFGQGVTFRVSKVCLLSRCGFNAPFAVEHEVLL